MNVLYFYISYKNISQFTAHKCVSYNHVGHDHFNYKHLIINEYNVMTMYPFKHLMYFHLSLGTMGAQYMERGDQSKVFSFDKCLKRLI